MAAFECRFHTTFDTAAALEPAWASLVDESDIGGPFQAPGFCLPWMRRFDRSTLVLACHDDDRLVGLAPLYVSRQAGVRALQVIGDTHCGEAAWLVARSADVRAVVEAMVRALGRAPVGWDALRFYGIKDAALLDALAGAARATRSALLSRRMGGSYFIDLSGGRDAVLGRISSRLKNTVRKRTRRADREGGVTFTVGAALDADAFREVLDVESASWKSEAEHRLFRDRAFFEEAFRRLGEAGRLRFCRLDFEGTLAAYLIVLKASGGRWLAYETAYRRACGQISAGTLVHYEEVLALAAQGARELDLLGAGEGYKADWSGETRDVQELVLVRRSLRGLLARGFFRLKWWAKEHLAARGRERRAGSHAEAPGS